MRLVGRVASEQLRRERLGRYFSPQIVERARLGDAIRLSAEHIAEVPGKTEAIHVFVPVTAIPGVSA